MSTATAAAPLREEDIRPAALMADKQACIEADRRFLLERRDRWVAVRCPACDGAASRPFGEKQGFAYVACAQCETVYTNPRPCLELLGEFYATSQNYAYWNERIFPATEASRRDRIFHPRAQRLATLIDKLGLRPRSVLEVGAAFGTFCEELRSLGRFERIVALEPTPGLAETCRRRGFETIEQTIESIDARPMVDLIAAFEVIEHLFSPRDFITRCRELLQPRGLLVVSCPNVRGFDMATLGVRSGSFDHEHLNYFHDASLPMLLRSCGFEVLEVQTPGQLDADIVRKRAMAGELDLSGQPLLRRVVLEEWDALGASFQAFLAENRLSSHLWVIAQRA